jgi:hypothetical protein
MSFFLLILRCLLLFPVLLVEYSFLLGQCPGLVLLGCSQLACQVVSPCVSPFPNLPLFVPPLTHLLYLRVFFRLGFLIYLAFISPNL